MSSQFHFGLPPPADDVAPRGTKAWRQAVNARRRGVADALWRAQHHERLNLPDPNAVSGYLSRLGITDEIGGGRHLRRLFMGDLPSEGFGMSQVPGRGNMSYAMEAYMPDWKWGRDYAIQGGHNTAPEANARFIPGPWQGAAPSGFGSSFDGDPMGSDSYSAPLSSGDRLGDDELFGMNSSFLKRRKGQFGAWGG